MGTGFRGTYVIAWAQTRLDGIAAPSGRRIDEGMTWRWTGDAMSLDGGGTRLLLAGAPDRTRAGASAAVRRMLQRPALTAAERAAIEADPVLEGGFIVSDGSGFYPVVPLDLGEGRAPILIFSEAVPPRNTDLTVIQGAAPQMLAGAAAILCFTPGTRIRTPDGDRPVEAIAPGDFVSTNDDGPRQVVWTGARRMSGARLHAMPQERPIRIRAGALGIDRPDGDLVLSPDHRVVLKGSAPRDLWGEPEVLVRAADLVGDRAVVVERAVRATTYIHLAFERHQIVWANGVETETFYPDPETLTALAPADRTALAAAAPGLGQGAPARRMVTSAEAAICLSGPLRRDRGRA